MGALSAWLLPHGHRQGTSARTHRRRRSARSRRESFRSGGSRLDRGQAGYSAVRHVDRPGARLVDLRRSLLPRRVPCGGVWRGPTIDRSPPGRRADPHQRHPALARDRSCSGAAVRAARRPPIRSWRSSTTPSARSVAASFTEESQPRGAPTWFGREAPPAAYERQRWKGRDTSIGWTRPARESAPAADQLSPALRVLRLRPCPVRASRGADVTGGRGRCAAALSPFFSDTR